MAAFDGFDSGRPDVACRLEMARAHLHARNESWQAVIDVLAEADTSSCADDAEQMDSAAARLRLLCVGRLAERAQSWVVAEAAYAQLAPSDPDARDRVGYAQGRQAEDLGNWKAAVTVYRTLPSALLDLDWRALYAEGRLAEEAGRWDETVAAYEAVARVVEGRGDRADGEPAPELGQIPQRTAYAQARRAEGDEGWDVMAMEAARLGGYRDAPELVAYAHGRMAERAAHWESAVEAYAGCPGRAAARIPYARARQLEDVGEWSAAIELMAPLAAVVEEVEARCSRLLRLRELLPWADRLAASGLVTDPVAMADPTFPYGALKAFGITPRSSAQDVKDGSYLLMERGGATADAWQAWHAVRFPAERMKIDAFLYRLADPDLLAAALRRVSPEAGAERLLEDLCQSDPADEPLLRLLAGDRNAALALWDARWHADSTDAAVAHSIACAYHWQASEAERAGDWGHVEAPWRRAIGSWSLVLTDEEHWEQWRLHRAECFGEAVTRTDVSRLRRNVSQGLADALAASAARAVGDGQAERALLYEGLAIALEVELEAARALKEVGGLPLPGGDDRLVGGPLSIHHAGLEPALAELVVQLEARQQSEASFTPSLGPSPTSASTLRRLRLLFSELAAPATLLDHGEPERALRLLPPLEGRTLANLPLDCDGPAAGDTAAHLDACAFCLRVARENPAYLLLGRRQARLFQDAVEIATRAHLTVAQSELTTGRDRIDAALTRWRTAIALAEAAGAQVRTKQAIVRVVIGRLDALRDAQGRRRGERLNDAVDLIERVLPIVGAVDRAQLLGKAAEVLTSRGIWLGYGCIEFDLTPDYERAAADLRRALELNPDSLHTRDNLARALVFRAADMVDPAETGQRLALLSEGFAILHDGLTRTGAHRQLLQMLGEALNGIQEAVLCDLTDAQLAAWVADATAPAAEGSDRAGRAGALAEDAMDKLRDGDADGALLALISATRARPEDELLRRTLLEALDRRRMQQQERT